MAPEEAALAEPAGQRDEAESDEAPARSLRDYLALPKLTWPTARVGARRTSSQPFGTAELTLLALILLAGAYLRFTGIDWDAGHHLHPDERFITMVEGAIRPGVAIQGPQGSVSQVRPAGLLETYFNTSASALNPHNVGFGFYVYGTFPLFAVRFIAEQLRSVGYDQVHILGRVLSAISDLATVALTYAAGRRLYGWRVGLLAGAFVAFCVMHIQQAHFFVFDSFLVTLVVASFYFCVDVAETGRRRSFVLAGFFLGLALATKLSMVLFAPVIALAGLVYLLRSGPGTGAVSPVELLRRWRSGPLWQVATGGLWAGLTAAVTFRVFQPYAFIGPSFFDLRLNPRWLENMRSVSEAQAGRVDMPPGIQFAATEPLLFPWRNMVLWGMGPAMGIVVWVGFFCVLAALLWRWRWQHLLVVFWAGLLFYYYGSVFNKTMRYILPAYPFFMLLGAWALVALYDWTFRLRLQALNLAGAPRTTPDGKPPGVAAERLRGIWLRAVPYVAEWGPRVAVGLAAVVVLASAAWSFAFTRIYTTTTTRRAASEWLYANAPAGSAIANEHWDDAIPVPLPGHDPGQYRGVSMPMYDPDEPRKVDLTVQLLTQADFINLTSNRLYGSIPRMPMRYPMTTEYYKRLFSGGLGFDLVHVEASYPRIGPLVINDDSAEEASTVYDHPKVLIFKKRPDFSPDKVRQILGAVPLDNVVQIHPLQVGRPTLIMPEWLRRANTAGGTWADQFSLDGAANALAPLSWYLVIQSLALLAAPLLWVGLTRLPDRGFGLAKPLGLLAVSWLAWTFAGYRILPWTRLTLLLAVAIVAVGSAVVVRKRGREWLAWLNEHRSLLVTSELVFAAAYVMLLFFRAANPDLWHPARGGEKPMEFSYLNAVVKSTYFPPYDPWFAGGYLNYYYFGYVLVAALIKLTGVMPAIGFNVAVAALYALLAAGCFSFAFNLSRLGGSVRFGLGPSLAAGVLGFVCVAFIGNLDGFAQFIERLSRAAGVSLRTVIPGVTGLRGLIAGLPAVVLSGRPIEPFDFWRSSRVIVTDNTINEFPFWTFLFADLHAHLISLPYQVAALGVLLHVTQTGLTRVSGVVLDVVPEGRLGPWLLRLLSWRLLAEIVAVSWLLGALYVINSWEFPTYLGLAAAAFLIAELTAQRGVTLGGLARAGVSTLGAFVLAKPLFRPFWQWYLTVYSSVEPWTQGRTRLDHYLIIHGLLVFGALTFVALAAGPVWRRTGWGRYLAARWRAVAAWDRFGALESRLMLEQRLPATGYLALFSATAAVMLVCRASGSTLLPFLVLILALVVAAAWERRDSAPLLFGCLLAGTGTALSMFVELFVLKGDIGRMNTVFKFYLQLWVFWALISGVAFAWAGQRLWSAFLVGRSERELEPEPVYRGRLILDEPIAAGAGDGLDPDLPVPVAGTREGELRHGRGVSGWAWAWAALAALLLVASLAYPLGATPARLADRFQQLPPTLDGMAYMAHMTLPEGNAEVRAINPQGVEIRGASDYAAIRWLLENVKGSPVILEAQIPEYRWGSRIAKYTGLPAVLGWRWHQAQQRGVYAPQVDQRQRDVQTMFSDASPARTQPLLNKYGVRYIYVGDLERAYYSAAGLAKFDQMTDALRPVYREGGVTIYEVLANVS